MYSILYDIHHDINVNVELFQHVILKFSRNVIIIETRNFLSYIYI